MANLDKTSVRNEIDREKADFELLCAKDKVSPEMKVLFNSLFMMMNLILSIFLEKTTKKHNQNSSIPSSQTDKDQTTPEQEGGHGKGKPEDNKLAKNTRTYETTSIIDVLNCDVCGEKKHTKDIGVVYGSHTCVECADNMGEKCQQVGFQHL